MATPPVIVAGDFNLAPDDPLTGRLTDAGWVDVTATAGSTMPNPDPVVRLDYIFAATGAWEVRGVQTFGAAADADGFLPSDHLGVVADLQLAR